MLKKIDTKHQFVGEYIEKGNVKMMFAKLEDNSAHILNQNTNEATFQRQTEKPCLVELN